MPQRILIIGSGFAGLWSALAAKRLINLTLKDSPQVAKSAEIEIAVVAPEPRLVLRPRLYEVDPGNMRAPLTDLFHAVGIRFIQGTVNTIRTEQHEVDVTDAAGLRSAVTYDRLILAAGSKLVHHDAVSGHEKHAFNVDQMEDAVRLETHLQGLKALSPSLARNTIVVCGAGFTGIEMATELRTHLKSIFNEQEVKPRVVLVGRENEIGPDLGPGPRPVITQALKELNVEVKLGSSVVSVDATGLTLSSGERIETLTAIWTAGMIASPLTQQIQGEKDNLGRLDVDHHLRIPSVPDVFVAGDMAHAATDDQGHYAMMSCQHALFLGRSAGHNAAADLLGAYAKAKPYTQVRYGTCLDLGEFGSVVCEGWDRNVLYSGAKAKIIKQYINGVLIYPPKAEDPAHALELADPDFGYTMDGLAAETGVACA